MANPRGGTLRNGILALALATMVAGAFAVPAARAAGADGAATSAASRRLRAAQSSWRAWLLADRPDLATRYGIKGAEDRLMPLSESGIDSARVRVARVRDAARRVDRAALPANETAALDTLHARIEREWATLESGAWRREPGLYAALTLEAVLDVAAPRKGVSPCERSRRAMRRLLVVPEALRAAQVSLRDASGFDRDSTLARWEAVLFRLRTELPPTLLACREPRRVAEVVEADSAALAAAQRFVRFVREDLVQSARPR
ncbi:MAG: hypothetical protein IT348_12375 [Candidatus Eisenbacteria bacterium]|nr:hypothetical protein [Candidatus Eisenbacteria bacterium]